MSSRETSISIDEHLLREARRLLQTDTIRETVQEPFREVLRAEARRREVEALRSMDGMDLDDPDLMQGAWRT
ncbi:MAG: hypothetical protein AAGC60_09780 [Acidobacteriota bacterium]